MLEERKITSRGRGNLTHYSKLKIQSNKTNDEK